MPDHEFHSKFLSRNQKAEKFREDVSGKIAGRLGNKLDGIISGMQRNTRIIAEYQDILYFVKPDGRVLTVNPFKMDEPISTAGWENIVGVAATYYFLAGLQRNGRVIVTEDRSLIDSISKIGVRLRRRRILKHDLKCIEGWTDIVAIDGSDEGFAGLRSDGTVVVCGDYLKEDKRKLESWRNIVQIACSSPYVYGLKKDGTVVSTDGFLEDELEEWTNVVSISAGPGAFFAALRSNGTVLTSAGGPDVSDWSGITRIAVGRDVLFGLDSNGDLKQKGGRFGKTVCDMRIWKNMKEIAVAEDPLQLVGVRKDGMIVTTIQDMAPANIND